MKNPSRILLFKGGVFLTSLSLVASFLLMEKKQNQTNEISQVFCPPGCCWSGDCYVPSTGAPRNINLCVFAEIQLFMGFFNKKDLDGNYAGSKTRGSLAL